MAYHYTDASRESDPHALPDVDVFYGKRLTETDPVGWHYAFGNPGCLDDSDPCGPYDTEAEALAAAREAAGFCPHGVSHEGAYCPGCKWCAPTASDSPSCGGTHRLPCEACPAPELWAWQLDAFWYACGSPNSGGRTADITRAMAWASEAQARESAGRMAFCDGGFPLRLSDADARRWGRG